MVETRKGLIKELKYSIRILNLVFPRLSCMKLILFTFYLFCIVNVIAQEKEYHPSAGNTSSKLYLGWEYSPEISYRFLSTEDEAPFAITDYVNWRNDHEIRKFAQSFNFFTGYRFNRSLSLELGLGYSNSGDLRTTNISPVEGGAPQESVGGTGFWTHQLHMLSAPLSLNFRYGKRKIKGTFSVGVAPSFLFKAEYREKIEYNDGTTNTYVFSSEYSLEQYSNFQIGVHFSSGMEYQYSKRGILRIAPVFRMLATNAYEDEVMKSNYFNVGINIGMIFKL